jgi:four helix bundle protein
MGEFYDLKVWQGGKALVVRIYQLTKGFPKQEMYGLTDQLRRAGNSVCANIAEGYGRHHPKEKIKFYYNARGSLYECKSHILVARELSYFTPEVTADRPHAKRHDHFPFSILRFSV